MSFTDDELREIYVNAPVEKDVFEVISLTAPFFTKTYHLQHTFTDGIEVVLETDQTVLAEYAPMDIGQASSEGNMNWTRTIVIEQVNDIIAAELANRDPELDQKITVEFRGYVMYRDGSVSSLKTPVIRNQVIEVDRDEVGSSISTSAKPISKTQTGETATTTRVPMLKGFQ